jgi:putative MATE family efflux protein
MEFEFLNKTMILRRGLRLASLYREPEYFHRTFTLAIPIILQQFISSSLNMVGSVMIGQLGETSVAAVGLANQIFFVLTLLLFGISSGSAIFTAQLWGKGDIPNIRRIVGLSLGLGLAGAALFLIIAAFFPAAALGVYSRDPAVVALGSGYLRIFGLSFLFTAVTFVFAAALRSTGNVKLPLVVSISALSLNTLLSYVLIFGKLGAPALGIQGAAVSVVIARAVEASAMVLFTYRLNSPVAGRLGEFIHLDRIFSRTVLRRVVPVAFNELIWALGVTAYNIVYARIGTESIAAVNIAVTIDNLAMVLFGGIAHACAILVGHLIGSGQERKAYQYAGKSISLGIIGALAVGGLILGTSGYLLALYKVSPQVTAYARNILVVIAALLWLRVANMVLFIGVLRSGGDTRFAFFLDCGGIWLVGVPLAFLGAFVFHLPVYFVYLMVMTEELVKFCIGMVRYFSKRWIHNVAHTV